MATTETLQHAGEFSLIGPNIIGSSGNQLDVGPLVLELNIYQSLDSPFMSGNILLNDAKGMYEYFPIIGQERLIFKLITPSSIHGIDFETYQAVIYNVEKRFNTNDRSQAYLLNFTTLDNYRNFRTKVSRAYRSDISTMVVQILSEELQSKKPVMVDPTKNPRSYVIPNLSPFRACNFLREEAISAEQQSPHYLFYENPLGYHFRSLDSLLGSQGSTVVQHKKTYTSQPPDDPKEIQGATGTILAFTVEDSNNTFANGRAGMFASTMYYHDVLNKTLQKYEYNYLDDCYSQRQQLNQDQGKFGPFISGSPVDGKKTITEFPDSKVYLHPTGGKEIHNEGSSGVPNYPYTNNNAPLWLQESISRELEREYFTIKIDTYGDTDLMVGDIIDVMIPSNKGVLPKSGGKDTMDTVLSGRYLITKLHHQVSPHSQAHKMTITAMKDSVTVQLPEDDIQFPSELEGVTSIASATGELGKNITFKPRSLPSIPTVIPKPKFPSNLKKYFSM